LFSYETVYVIICGSTVIQTNHKTRQMRVYFGQGNSDVVSSETGPNQ